MKRLSLLLLLLLACLSGCGQRPVQETPAQTPEKTMALDYATEFSVDYYAHGYKLITLGDESRFLVVPEGGQAPGDLPQDVVPLYQPLDNLYLAASAAMCLFDALDSLDVIAMTGTQQEDWSIENAKTAMAQGKILYAGKYNEPDYEMILEKQCPLAVESLMIGHASEVKDKLEELGVAVLVDQSSKESHPLGRTEWIKLYGALLNKEAQAEAIFAQQKAFLDAVDAQDTGATAAFFYINSSGSAVVRKSDDYISKMIHLAGGTYVFQNFGDPEKGTSSENLEMEAFFAAAKEADYLIYNSTIDDQVKTLDDLLAKSPLLSQMKAVQTGNVWGTGQNMYQETTGLGEMIQSFHQIFSGQAQNLEELPYLYRLR